ncbi:MAG TPA: succinylglutamate desuccinylase/aspartoacylase family protein [Anaerolineae bacterium]|nr:succinylglutamate desuccinylase/aspartoacylase family protein [Anaerolineae bacterium]
MADVESPITTDLDFERDGKQVSYLRVPHSRNDSAWGSIQIPISVVRNGPGATILFTGGVHGDEYEGPVCLSRLSRELQAHQIQGRVIIIPSLNLPASLAGRRLSPVDGKDLNRVFPGSPCGTMSQIIADYVQRALLPLCDAVVDLHSGGYSLRFVPYISMHYLDDRALTERTFAALKAFNAPVGLIIKETSGQGLLDYEVEDMGKVFLCAELGGGGMLSTETLRITRDGVYNLLAHFGLFCEPLPATPGREAAACRLMEVPDGSYYHAARMAGVYEPLVDLGDWVEAGELLGQVHALEDANQSPQPVAAQQPGLLIGVRAPARVERGDCLGVVARDL